MMQLLLDKGADPNIQGPRGMTALMGAVICGNQDMTTLLLDKRADPNIADGDGNTPLMYLIDNNQKWGVKMLLDRGARLNILDANNITPLMNAILNKNIEIVDIIVDSGRIVQLERRVILAALSLPINRGLKSIRDILENGSLKEQIINKTMGMKANFDAKLGTHREKVVASEHIDKINEFVDTEASFNQKTEIMANLKSNREIGVTSIPMDILESLSKLQAFEQRIERNQNNRNNRNNSNNMQRTTNTNRDESFGR